MNLRKVTAGVLAYLITLGVYFAFFTYPVEPAGFVGSEYSKVKEEVYSNLPYVVYRVYIRSSVTPGILLIATVRTPFLPDSTYSRILREMEGIIENETRERYNADIDLVLVGERSAVIENRTVVMDEYDVYLDYRIPSFGRPKVVKLYFGAFFCRERYESIVVAYVEPPVFEGDFSKVMGGVKC